jgi:molecular chaperone HscB
MTNYFAILGLEPTIDIDEALLRKQYYRLQRQFHPDLDNSLKAASQAANISEAYRIISNPDQRLHHVLELHKALPAEGQAQIPHDFLIGMLDINEAIDDAGGNPQAITSIQSQIDIIQKELDSHVRPAIERFTPHQVSNADLSLLVDYYLKCKYIQRLLERINHTQH